MTPTPRKRLYITSSQDGSIVSILGDATVSIIKLEDDGSTLVEHHNGTRTVLVENDVDMAPAMFKALLESMVGPDKLPSTDPVEEVFKGMKPQPQPWTRFGDSMRFELPRSNAGLVLSLLAATAVGIVLACALGAQLTAWKPDLHPVLERPAQTAPLVPAESSEARTVEEINAAKGPQRLPTSNEPPAQPAIQLPSAINVVPDTELAPVVEEPTTATPEPTSSPAPVSENPAAAAPTPPPSATGTPASTDLAPAAEGDIFGERIEANQAILQEIQDAARANIAATGPDLAAEQIDEMRAALDLLRSGQKLTPEAVTKLPPEIAAVMQAQGLVMTAEEAVAAANALSNAPPVSLVRLPAAVVDRYRDADGIPTIPEANSWLALGASGPGLPLPGSGEIRRPEDLGRFGLQY